MKTIIIKNAKYKDKFIDDAFIKKFQDFFAFCRIQIDNDTDFVIIRKMKESHMIWTEFMNDNVDEMSILKLQKVCKDFDEHQSSGHVVLNYQGNNIFQKIPSDIQHIKWKECINRFKHQQLNGPVQYQIYNDEIDQKHVDHDHDVTQPEIQLFLDIMQRYSKIVNNNNKDAMQKIKLLLQEIKRTLNMSRMMDVLFTIRSSDQTAEQCQMKSDCSVFKYYALQRRTNTLTSTTGALSIEERASTELLDTIHTHLYHSDMERSQRTALRQNVNDIWKEKLPLFMNKLIDSDLKLLYLYCMEQEYDSDAFYDDVFPDNDGQSNIYHFCRQQLHKFINNYYTLKAYLSNHMIQPVDATIIKRNLIDLDFGDHITDWNVKPKFENVKQEWLQNNVSNIPQTVYKSIRIKCEIIANQNKNTNGYNLSADDILCVKVYTDTDDLQSSFRSAFRSSSYKNQRAQFVHWAVRFHIVYIQIEAKNEINGFNRSFCNLTLHHGLSRLFDTKGLNRQFFGPLSTTTEESVAAGFSGDAGMILQIDQETNNSNMCAMEVDWISCHKDEKEVLLLNPNVMIRTSHVFLNNIEMKSQYLKSIILLALMEDPDAFETLCSFFQSTWIETSLEDLCKDKSFMDRMNMFVPKQILHGMSLFQFIFFRCQHYQIASYIDKYYNYDKSAYEIIVGNDFFIIGNNDIQNADRSQKLCTKYPPRMCTMKLTYDYSDDAKFVSEFGTKQGKEMLVNTGLILQQIDQTKLNESKQGLTITMSMKIKYQFGYWDENNFVKSANRIWRCELNDYIVHIRSDCELKIQPNAT
eukprot:81998_1